RERARRHPLGERGGEPPPGRPARRIVERGRQAPLGTTPEWVDATKAGVPRPAWSHRTHVATRTFQALRMAVNEEMPALQEALDAAPELLERGGRLGVIAFHSGEDRAGKRALRAPGARGFASLEPSPMTPSPDETRDNPRAPGAQPRVLERMGAAQRARRDARREAGRDAGSEPRHRRAAARRSGEMRASMRTGRGHQMPIQMSLGLRPPSTANQQMAHFHRESDHHRLRAMLTGAMAAGVLVTLVL